MGLLASTGTYSTTVTTPVSAIYATTETGKGRAFYDVIFANVDVRVSRSEFRPAAASELNLHRAFTVDPF